MTLSPSFFHQHMRSIQLALLLLVIFGVPVSMLIFPDYATPITWGVILALAAVFLWTLASQVAKFMARPAPPPLAEQAAWEGHLKMALEQKYPGYQNLLNAYLNPTVLTFDTRRAQNAARELERTLPLLFEAWEEQRNRHTMGADPIYEAQKWLDEGDFFYTSDGVAFEDARRQLVEVSTASPSSSS